MHDYGVNMKNTKDFYNKTAIEWADKWYQDETMLPCLKEFISKFDKEPIILDLCCGAGYESMRMHQIGAEVIGIDFSEASIKIAKERNTDIEFYVDNMLNDYSYIGKVDGIAVIAGLIHLENEQLERAFRSMQTVLSDSGLVLIVVKEGTGKREQQSFVTIDNEDYDRNFIAHTLDELCFYSNGILEFVEEILPDDMDAWKRYLFKKLSL